MSKLMKNLLSAKAEHSKKIQEKFQGEAYLYMGDPSLHWGVGGWVRGKANLVYGPKGSGKSSLCIKAAGEEQKRTNGWVVVFDSEYAWQDPNEEDVESGELTDAAKDARIRYTLAGLDYEKLLIISSNQPDTLFGSLGDIEKEVKSGDLNISAMIVDSWAGIQGENAAKKIEEGEIAAAGNAFGGNAKMMGPILQTLLRISAENGITSLFVQHCIQNMDGYGPRWKLLGGERLKYLVHCVLFVESIEAKDAGLFDGDMVNDKGEGIKVGKRIRFRCEKSRKVVEGRQGEFYMNFKELRFARPEESLFNLAVNLGIIGHPRTYQYESDGVTPKIDKKTGQPAFTENKVWWCFPAKAESPMKFQGQAKAIEAIRNDKNLYNQIWEACMTTDSLSGLKDGESVTQVESV